MVEEEEEEEEEEEDIYHKKEGGQIGHDNKPKIYFSPSSA